MFLSSSILFAIVFVASNCQTSFQNNAKTFSKVILEQQRFNHHSKTSSEVVQGLHRTAAAAKRFSKVAHDLQRPKDDAKASSDIVLKQERPDANTKRILDVVLDLQRLYHAHCVYLVASKDSLVTTGSWITHAQKLLTAVGVFTSVIGLDRLKSSTNCHTNRPLNVIVDLDEQTRSFLATLLKVPPHPRWLALLDVDPAVALRDVNIEFDCEFLTLRAHQGGVAVMELYRMQRGAPLVVEKFAEWTPERRLDKRGQDFDVRRANLRGVTLRACVRNLPPMVTVTLTNSTSPRLGGFFGSVWNVLETKLNFTTEYTLPADGQTGIKLQNGTWTGCMSMLLRNESDVAVCDFTMTTDRVQVAAFLFPTLTAKQRYYMLEPTTVNLSWDNFLAPFAPRLWLAVVTSVALLSLALLGTHRCARFLGLDGEEFDSMDPSKALVYMLGLACGQGHDITPRTTSGRIVYQIGAMTSIVVSAAYAAALISFLTVVVKEYPVNSFQELLDKRYKLGVRSPSGQLTLFETTLDPLLRKVNALAIQPIAATLPRTVIEGLLRACAEPAFGFLTFPESLPKRLPCALAPVPNIAIPIRFSVVTAKENPFHGILDTNMLKVLHSGALQGVRLRFWPKVYPAAKQDTVEVSLPQSTPILAILVAGVLAGTFLLCLELAVYRRRHRTYTLGPWTRPLCALTRPLWTLTRPLCAWTRPLWAWGRSLCSVLVSQERQRELRVAHNAEDYFE